MQLELWAKILEPKGYGTLSQTQVDIVHMQVFSHSRSLSVRGLGGSGRCNSTNALEKSTLTACPCSCLPPNIVTIFAAFSSSHKIETDCGLPQDLSARSQMHTAGQRTVNHHISVSSSQWSDERSMIIHLVLTTLRERKPN